MKKTIFSALAWGIIVQAHAQSATQWEVLASQGGTARNETTQVEWTLGEPATSAAYSGNTGLTEGFHQPDFQLIVLNEATPPGITHAIQVFPNPTTGILQVIVENAGARLFRISLTDSNGRLITTQRMQPPAVQTLDLTACPSGVYRLHIQSADDLHNEVYQVIKQQ